MLSARRPDVVHSRPANRRRRFIAAAAGASVGAFARAVGPALAAAGSASAGVAASGAAWAQATAYPSRPIRLVIPFPAGGATDLLGRAVGQRLGTELGQPVVVENRPGAGGTIGADTVANAAPDGYTLLMATSSTHSIGPVLNPKIPYDAFSDFAPIACVAEGQSVLVVGRDSPAKSARELVDLVKRRPGQYNFGSSGIGTYPHLAGEMFKWRAGNLFVVHIPYRGTGLVMTDLVSGQVAFLMDSIVSAQAHIRDGKVRPLAVSGRKRSSTLPDVPTFAEIGIGGMEFVNWFGVFGPARMPAALVAQLNQALKTVVDAPETRERFEKLGAEPRWTSAADFDKLFRDESKAWKDVIARANIKVE
ncbi:MAG: tripartite tricarboxylate transporter substrate binding protein [Burkholderiaceae bacterium]